jgi:uncharacterized protein (TIGR03067 family)
MRLPANTAPQAIDLDQTPDAKGWSRHGIVKLTGDTLTLSIDFPQSERPKDFTPADHGREVVVFQRVPGP